MDTVAVVRLKYQNVDVLFRNVNDRRLSLMRSDTFQMPFATLYERGAVANPEGMTKMAQR